MPPFFFMAYCPWVYSGPCFSTLIPWLGNFSKIFEPAPFQRSYYMPCLFIASFCISTLLLSVIYIVLDSYWSWHLNVCWTIPPNVVHTRYNHCAYIGCMLCIQFFCLCMRAQKIWVSVFFQNAMHAHVPLTVQVSPIFWQIFLCLVSCNQYFFEISCGIFL